MKLTEEELAAKAIQLIQSGLWRGFIVKVIEARIVALNDGWQNFEEEKIKEKQIEKKNLEWLKEIPHRYIQEANERNKEKK